MTFLAHAAALTPQQHTLWEHAWHDWQISLSSERTRRAYAEAWAAFERFSGKHPAEITQSDVLAYRHALETTPSARTGQLLSTSSINLYLSALRSFYNWLNTQRPNVRADNPAAGVRQKSVTPYGKATFLRHRDQAALLAAIPRDTLQGKRDYALVALLLTTGVRVSVIANAYLRDIEHNGSVVRLAFINKGGAAETVELKPNTMQAIQAYLDARGPVEPDAPLFVATEAGKRAMHNAGLDTAQERPLSARMVNKLIYKYARRALGPRHGIHAHSLRHTAALNASRHSNLATVSKFLKHKNPHITSIYLDHLDTEAVSELADKLDDMLNL